VCRFVVKDNVEERMVAKIHARKRFIAGSLGMVSQTEEERREQRIEDIRDCYRCCKYFRSLLPFGKFNKTGWVGSMFNVHVVDWIRHGSYVKFLLLLCL